MIVEKCFWKCLITAYWSVLQVSLGWLCLHSFLASNNLLFSPSLSSHSLCSCLEFVTTTNNLCNFWRSKLQQITTHAFCSGHDIFTQESNCSSPNNLFNCTKIATTLSTNTSIEWKLYLSWSNHLVTSFRLEVNVRGFRKSPNKKSDTDNYKGCFFTAPVPQVNVNTINRIFAQWS